MTHAAQAGNSFPLGATVGENGVNFSLFSRTATGVELLLFDEDDNATPARVVRFDPVSNRTYHYWHAFVPGVLPGQLYGFRVEGPDAPTRGLRFDSSKSLARSVRQGRRGPEELQSAVGNRAGRQRRLGDEKRRCRSKRRTTGKETNRCACRSAQTIIYEMHVRGFHAPSELRRRRNAARHLCRPDREDSVSAATRHHRRRIAARVSVRRAGLPAGKDQLLGLCADLVLRTASGVQLPAGSARSGRRIPRHGEGAAPRRHRSHSRRRVQPHGRRRPTRTDALLSRHRQPNVLHSRRRRRVATPTTPAAETH